MATDANRPPSWIDYTRVWTMRRRSIYDNLPQLYLGQKVWERIHLLQLLILNEYAARIAVARHYLGLGRRYYANALMRLARGWRLALAMAPPIILAQRFTHTHRRFHTRTCTERGKETEGEKERERNISVY